MSVRTGAVLTASELRDRLNSDTRPQLLDVRTPGDSGDAVFVCRSGQRAAGARALHGSGWSRGSVLEAGIVAWEGNGYDAATLVDQLAQ